MNPMKTKSADEIVAHDALVMATEHWKRMRDGTAQGNEAPTGSQCKLCELFYTRRFPMENYCTGCPVSAHTGKSHCGNTPFYKALESFNPAVSSAGQSKKFKKAAAKEVKFLEYLLTEPSSREVVFRSVVKLVMILSSALAIGTMFVYLVSRFQK